MIKEAKNGKKKRIVELPKKLGSPAAVCVMASGDLGLKAKNAKADKVIDEGGLKQMTVNKRESRKLINNYDFFLADTKLMPVVGKLLGQLLGPRGKMPTPVPFNAPIESILERFRSSVRIRVRNSLSLSCNIGDESMTDQDLAAKPFLTSISLNTMIISKDSLNLRFFLPFFASFIISIS